MRGLGNFKWGVLCFLLLVFTFNSAEAKSFKRFKVKKGLAKRNASNKFRQVYDENVHRTRTLGNQIIVKFKKSFRKSNIQRFALKNNLTVVNRLGKRTFVFASEDQANLLNVLNTLEVNKEEKERSLVSKADIDEYKKLSASAKRRARKNRGKNVAKFNLSRQWHLKNIGNSSVSKAGADINALSIYGRNALHIAANSGKNEVILYLLEKGFDINAKTEYDETPLKMALNNGKDGTARLLLTKGAK